MWVKMSTWRRNHSDVGSILSSATGNSTPSSPASSSSAVGLEAAVAAVLGGLEGSTDADNDGVGGMMLIVVVVGGSSDTLCCADNKLRQHVRSFAIQVFNTSRHQLQIMKVWNYVKILMNRIALWCNYPVPDRCGDGVLLSIDLFVYIFVCLFLSSFVSLLDRLP